MIWGLRKKYDPNDPVQFALFDILGEAAVLELTVAQLVADGKIKPEDLENERKKNQEETDRIFKLASTTTYQLSSSQRRDVDVDDDDDLYNAFYELIEFDGGEPADDMILLRAEGSHRIVFINKGALDYVSIPTHKYEAGSVEAAAAALEGME
jgi:hypothetical protein